MMGWFNGLLCMISRTNVAGDSILGLSFTPPPQTGGPFINENVNSIQRGMLSGDTASALGAHQNLGLIDPRLLDGTPSAAQKKRTDDRRRKAESRLRNKLRDTAQNLQSRDQANKVIEGANLENQHEPTAEERKKIAANRRQAECRLRNKLMREQISVLRRQIDAQALLETSMVGRQALEARSKRLRELLQTNTFVDSVVALGTTDADVARIRNDNRPKEVHVRRAGAKLQTASTVRKRKSAAESKAKPMVEPSRSGPSEQRKRIVNCLAQRTFRERQAAHIQSLEQQIPMLEKKTTELTHQMQFVTEPELQKLRMINARLAKSVAQSEFYTSEVDTHASYGDTFNLAEMLDFFDNFMDSQNNPETDAPPR
jgi:hypothetical protein